MKSIPLQFASRLLPCVAGEMGMMKKLSRIIAGLLILAGGVFLLQGINILPGSFMSGDPVWARNGIIMVLIGIGLLIWTHRE